MEKLEQSIRSFWVNNWRWFVTIIFFAGVNFATINITLQNKMTKQETQTEINTTLEKEVFPLIKATQNEIETMKKESSQNLSIAKEIKYNLKTLMKANGLEYIEDTDR